MSNQSTGNGRDKFAGKNIADYAIAVPVKGYRIAAWTPERDGKGKPEQVHLVMEMDLSSIEGMEDAEGIAAMRFKAPHAIDSLIADLRRYRDEVWPLGFVPGRTPDGNPR